MGLPIQILRQETFNTIECCRCGVVFAVASVLQGNWKRDKTEFYCPNGHNQSYAESTAERIKRELTAQLDAAKRDAEWERVRAKEAEKRERAMKGQITKLKKRVNCGVCPHCQRTVKQMAAHIASKHPEVLKKETTSVD